MLSALGEAMRRRDFILLGGFGVAWPLAARAQEPGRVYRLGGLFQTPKRSAVMDAFFGGMRQYGFIEGQNLLADPNGYELRTEQFAGHASEIVKQGVDLIVVGAGDAAIRAAQQATKIIPIIAGTEDMLGSGFVHSMARPEGNLTGHSIMSFEMNGKRQEILMELLPAARHMAALTDTYTYSPERLQTLQELTRRRGVELSVYRVPKPEEIAGAIEAAKNSGALALNVLASVFVYVHRRTIYERVAALSLPAMYQFPEMAEEGGLIGYGPSIIQVWRESVPRQAAALLRGAKVADVPVEQPSKFELVINLKTAKALGLTIPESFLARADKVIE
jgi:putative tryptophan/tyrosine transport system substrate-binding protein